MRNILNRIHNAVSIIITWIDTPLVTCMWMRSKLQQENVRALKYEDLRMLKVTKDNHIIVHTLIR